MEMLNNRQALFEPLYRVSTCKERILALIDWALPPFTVHSSSQSHHSERVVLAGFVRRSIRGWNKWTRHGSKSPTSNRKAIHYWLPLSLNRILCGDHLHELAKYHLSVYDCNMIFCKHRVDAKAVRNEIGWIVQSRDQDTCPQKEMWTSKRHTPSIS